MAGIESGITIMENIFFRTAFAEQSWMMHLVIIAATMIMITRKPGDWAGLLLPVMVGWNIFGMQISVILYAIAVPVFIIDTLGTKVISDGLGIASQGASAIRMPILGKKRRMSKMKKLMEKGDIKAKEKEEYEKLTQFKGKYKQYKELGLEDSLASASSYMKHKKEKEEKNEFEKKVKDLNEMKTEQLLKELNIKAKDRVAAERMWKNRQKTLDRKRKKERATRLKDAARESKVRARAGHAERKRLWEEQKKKKKNEESLDFRIVPRDPWEY